MVSAFRFATFSAAFAAASAAAASAAPASATTSHGKMRKLFDYLNSMRRSGDSTEMLRIANQCLSIRIIMISFN